VRHEESLALVRALRPAEDGIGSLRALSAEHANTVHIVDERYVVKWYTDPETGGNREPLLLTRLTRQGVQATPAAVGALTAQSATLALVTEYLPDAVDGWTLLSDLDPVRDEARLLALCRAFGETLAVLHRGLSGETSLESAGSRLARVRSRVPGLPPDLLALPGPLRTQAVHGDLHLGQFLVSGQQIRIVDLEGDPRERPADRQRFDCPLRDLASLRRSLALLRLRKGGCHRQYLQAVEALTAAYLAVSPLAPTEWLPILEVEKAAAELRHAEGFLPSSLRAAKQSYQEALAVVTADAR
jgi:maltokinase